MRQFNQTILEKNNFLRPHECPKSVCILHWETVVYAEFGWPIKLLFPNMVEGFGAMQIQIM